LQPLGELVGDGTGAQNSPAYLLRHVKSPSGVVIMYPVNIRRRVAMSSFSDIPPTDAVTGESRMLWWRRGRGWDGLAHPGRSLGKDPAESRIRT